MQFIFKCSFRPQLRMSGLYDPSPYYFEIPPRNASKITAFSTQAYFFIVILLRLYIEDAEWNMMQIVWDLCFWILPTNNPRHTTLHHSKPRRKTFIFYRDFESNTYFTKLFSCLILKTPGSALRLFLGIITYIGIGCVIFELPATYLII